MQTFLLLLALCLSPFALAEPLYPLTLKHTVAIPRREKFPENYKGAKAFVLETHSRHGRDVPVMVQKFLIPVGSQLEYVMEKELAFHLYLTDWNVIVGHSKPYFRTRVLSFPPEAKLSPADRETLQNGEIYVNTGDLDPSKIVALREHHPLPPGIKKAAHILPWDAWNPEGNWAYAIELALANKKNSFLLKNPPADVEYFCPEYKRLDTTKKLAFWQTMLSEMSWRESSFVPFTFSDEGKYTSGAEGILSTGLMQLSIASTKNACYQDRGCAVIRSQKDLFDPEKNLTCAVAVISCLTEKASCFSCRTGETSWNGAARYWSVLREKHSKDCPTCMNGKVTLGKKEELLDVLKSSAPFCHAARQ